MIKLGWQRQSESLYSIQHQMTRFVPTPLIYCPDRISCTQQVISWCMPMYVMIPLLRSSLCCKSGYLMLNHYHHHHHHHHHKVQHRLHLLQTYEMQYIPFRAMEEGMAWSRSAARVASFPETQRRAIAAMTQTRKAWKAGFIIIWIPMVDCNRLRGSDVYWQMSEWIYPKLDSILVGWSWQDSAKKYSNSRRRICTFLLYKCI